ncbi:MAG TPA: hypothetical protein VHA07_01360 [Devosia sp.]|nr:hypothetical protein [Devosia sp.]
MRNPIQPSPDRPIPLPDCILMDGWWADRPVARRGERGSLLRLVIGDQQGARHDRPDGDGRRPE